MYRLIIFTFLVILTGLVTLKSQEFNSPRDTTIISSEQMTDEVNEKLIQLERKTRLLFENHSRVEQALWESDLPASHRREAK